MSIVPNQVRVLAQSRVNFGNEIESPSSEPTCISLIAALRTPPMLPSSPAAASELHPAAADSIADVIAWQWVVHRWFGGS